MTVNIDKRIKELERRVKELEGRSPTIVTINPCPNLAPNFTPYYPPIHIPCSPSFPAPISIPFWGIYPTTSPNWNTCTMSSSSDVQG